MIDKIDKKPKTRHFKSNPANLKQQELFPLDCLPALRGKNLIFLDLETTGKDPKLGHEIIEIFLLKCDSSGNEIGRFHSYIRPTKRISYGAFKAHGKDPNALQNFPTAIEVLSKIKEFISPNDILCGYNIQDFDIPFLNYQLKKLGLPLLTNRLIDVYKIVREEFKNKSGYGLETLKLEEVAKYLGIESGISHQAGDDVFAVKEVFMKFVQERRKAVEEYTKFLPWSPLPEEDKQIDLRNKFFQEVRTQELIESLEKLEMGLEEGYIKHEYLKPRTLLAKPEQVVAAARALNQPLLIGMDTSLGKTIIVFLMSAHLKKKNAGKIIFLVPFLGIIDDHKKDFDNFMRDLKLGILTGQTRKDHEKLIAECDFLMGTPETVYRLSVKNKIPWKNVALLVIDEGHKIKEKFYGREIVEAYRKNQNKPLITALTATIGESLEEVKNMLENFGIPFSPFHIILKDKKDVDYPHQTEEERIQYKSLNTHFLQSILKEAIVREMDIIHKEDGLLEKHHLLKTCLDKIDNLRNTGKFDWPKLSEILEDYFQKKYNREDLAEKKTKTIIDNLLNIPEKEEREIYFKWNLYVPILADYVQEEYLALMKEEENFSSMKAAGKIGSLRHLYTLISSDHLMEAYLAAQRIKNKDTQGASELCKDPKINLLFKILEMINNHKSPGAAEQWEKNRKILPLPPLEELTKDPRLEEIIRIVKDYRLSEEKVLILTDLRDTVEKIAKHLQDLGLPVGKVWGSQRGETKGMTAKEKRRVVEDFRSGKIKILVSTKFLGLGVNLDFDILVIENLSVNPKEWVQMTGRAGRSKEGHIYYLLGDNEAEQVREWELKGRLKEMAKTRKFYRR